VFRHRSTARGRPAGVVATLLAATLVASACSGSSSTGSAAPTTSGNAVVVNHAAYRFAAAHGLAWYVLPPRNRQRSCHPSCTAQLVRPAFRSNVIASVDVVPAKHHSWRLIIALRRPATDQLARVTKHHRRGSEIVIAVGNHFLVHAPLRQPIVNGVWQISGLSRTVAARVARVLQSIAHGYPKPARHHHRHHHHERHRHRHHHHKHRHHHHKRHRHHHRRHHQHHH
jgi:hypothetical protein